MPSGYDRLRAIARTVAIARSLLDWYFISAQVPWALESFEF